MLTEYQPMFATQQQIDRASIDATWELTVVGPATGLGTFQVHAFVDMNGPFRVVAQTTSREAAAAVIRLIRASQMIHVVGHTDGMTMPEGMERRPCAHREYKYIPDPNGPKPYRRIQCIECGVMPSFYGVDEVPLTPAIAKSLENGTLRRVLT